jgi:hypothetical protein
MSNTADVFRNLLPQIEQDQQTIEALKEENRQLLARVQNLEEALEVVGAEDDLLRDRVKVLHALIQGRDQELRQTKEGLRQERQGRQQAEAESDLLQEELHRVEAKRLERERETSALIQEADDYGSHRVEEALGLLREERLARAEAEAVAKKAVHDRRVERRRRKRTQRKLDEMRQELAVTRDNLAIEREANQVLRDQLDAK